MESSNSDFSATENSHARGMFKELLGRPFTLLWLGIVAIRLLFAHEFVGRFLAAPWFDVAFLIYVLSVVGAEFVILRRASKAYETSFLPTAGSGDIEKPQKSGSKKFGIALFVFCLSVGLWESRNEPIAIAAGAILVGSAFNLLVTASLTHLVLAARGKARQIQPS